jgi:hypothetical protein
MQYLATTGTAGVIEINGTVIVELLTFLVMLAVLARYVYPEVVKVAEARRRAGACRRRSAAERSAGPTRGSAEDGTAGHRLGEQIG